MEGPPDEESQRGRRSGPAGHPYQRPRNPPNLWILVGLTALALALAAAVLLATTF